jgi:hypothetical protein
MDLITVSGRLSAFVKAVMSVGTKGYTVLFL